MRNIIIFGGAFDPIHNTHINMAKKACAFLNNALVYFVPTRTPRWKISEATASQRLKMVELAIQKEKKFKLCDYEIKSKRKTNYTLDTVKYFKKIFPKDNLYFLIGGDQVNQFDNWYKPIELSNSIQLLYIERKNVFVDQNLIKKYHFKKIPSSREDSSSTNIRNFESINVPTETFNFILDNNLYFLKNIKSFYEEKRYEHVKRVTKLAYEIAVVNNLKESDINKLFIASLLHDIAKKFDINKIKKLTKKYFPKYVSLNKEILHQFAGAAIAKEKFGIKNKEILNAISYHTTGRKNMSKIEKILYCADKIEPGRGFDNSKFIRKLKSNLEEGFLYTLKENIKYFKKNKIAFNNCLTEQCMNYFLK